MKCLTDSQSFFDLAFTAANKFCFSSAATFSEFKSKVAAGAEVSALLSDNNSKGFGGMGKGGGESKNWTPYPTEHVGLKFIEGNRLKVSLLSRPC